MDDDNGEMNTNEAARQIGIPAKKLRGHIRADENNLGVAQQDGRWVFTARDVARLRQVFAAKPEVINRKEELDADLTPYQKLVISRKDKRVNKEVMERHIAREDRLQAGLRRVGIYTKSDEE